MSNTQFAFIKGTRVPSREALQASIDSLGFDMQVDPELKLLEDEGFSPCTLGGRGETGFELFVTSTSDVIEDEESLADIASDNDTCLSLVWHGSMRDLACVMIVSCALARDFGAIISFEGETPEPLETLLSGARDALKDAAAE